MSRLFDGSDDQVSWLIGDVVSTGAFTIAVVAKLAGASSSWNSMVNLMGADDLAKLELTRRGTSDTLTVTTLSESTMVDSTGSDWVTADGWSLVTVSKAAGTNTPRFTRYPLSGSPQHADGGATLANAVATTYISFGAFEGVADFFSGRVAAIGIWNTALSDADRASLGSTLTRANWLSLNPDFLVDELDVFNTDHAGTSTLAAIVGTTDDADDPPGWSSWAAATNFPQVVATSTFADAANGLTHVVPLPTPSGGILANDLLVCFSGLDGNPAITNDRGFTEIVEQAEGGTANLYISYLRCAGGETGNLTITTSTSEGGGHRILCIRGAHTTEAPSVATPVGAITANPNPPSHNPSGWDIEDTLWIACASNDGNVAITAGPSGFSNFGNTRWANTAGAGIATATLESAVASVDPGTFTMTAEENLATTTAIRPAAAAADPIIMRPPMLVGGQAYQDRSRW